MAVEAGAQEVDVVIPVGDMLEKNHEKVYRELVAIREACEGVRLKVILETGELKSLETIFEASVIAAYAGADFIKTSTGKVPVNATIVIEVSDGRLDALRDSLSNLEYLDAYNESRQQGSYGGEESYSPDYTPMPKEPESNEQGSESEQEEENSQYF